MERETKTFMTPQGKELKIKTYLTARERNQLRDSLLKESNFSVENGEAQMGGMKLSGKALTESQNELIKVAVASYGGITAPDAILETLLDSTAEEYDFVVLEAGKINQNFQGTK